MPQELLSRTIDLRSPAAQKTARDRAIAMAYLEAGGRYGVIRDLARSIGIDRKTVYRAIKRELAWAKAQTPEDLPQETHI